MSHPTNLSLKPASHNIARRTEQGCKWNFYVFWSPVGALLRSGRNYFFHYFSIWAMLRWPCDKLSLASVLRLQNLFWNHFLNIFPCLSRCHSCDLYQLHLVNNQTHLRQVVRLPPAQISLCHLVCDYIVS